MLTKKQLDSLDLSLKILACPMVEWATEVEALTDDQKTRVGAMLDSNIERAARLRGYLDQRGAAGTGDSGHAAGVKSSNSLTTKVRRALGFSMPRRDVRF